MIDDGKEVCSRVGWNDAWVKCVIVEKGESKFPRIYPGAAARLITSTQSVHNA